MGLVVDAELEEELCIRHLQVADATRASLGLPVHEYYPVNSGIPRPHPRSTRGFPSQLGFGDQIARRVRIFLPSLFASSKSCQAATYKKNATDQSTI